MSHLFPKLASIDERHNEGNQSSGGENDAYYVKTHKSKIETAAYAERADEETENESQERLTYIGIKEFFFLSNAVGSLFFHLSYEPIGEARDY
jgi:hypothetical protein